MRFIVRLSLLLGLHLFPAATHAAGERPNIVYFFADDLGWAGIKANQALAAAAGKNMSEAGKIITPNMDAIVASGMNFTRSYGNPVCSPSRSCQQTGFHQGHTWSDRNDPDASKAMRTQDPTVGKLLAAAGYRNGMYGKWGYGATDDLNNPVINNDQTLPIRHGYHDCLVELHHVRAHTFNQPSLWYSFTNDAGVVTTDTTLRPNSTTYPELKYSSGKWYVDDLYAAAAGDFIRTEIAKQKTASQPKPFFAQISFQVPHSPYGDIESTVDGWFDDYAATDTSSWTAGMKQYAAMITHMDKRIGEIIALLADPDGNPATQDSVMANTLIILASDNGGASDAPPTAFNINGHLTKTKTHVYEGGIRVPLAFRWDGTIAAGQTNTRRVCITDILPTFCELAGIDAPTGIDGVSFAPLLTGTGTLHARPWLAYEDHDNAAWDWALIKDDYKLIQNNNGGPNYYLYNLKTDESESQNRVAWPAEQDRLAEMLAIARAEHLDEADTYANVFPTWVGADFADINAASSWQETGTWPFTAKWPYGDTPQPHWNAIVRNTATADRTAVLNNPLQTLGFELAGNPATSHTQTLTLGAGVTLDGRNEIRLSPHSLLHLDGGTLSSTRFLGIRADATLRGAGTVAADLENHGTLDIIHASDQSVPGEGAELIQNGGFENGTPDPIQNDYSYASITAWTTDPTVDQSADAAVDDGANTGTYRGLVHGTPAGQPNIPLIQNTGVPILAGDRYTLSFHHIGKSGWEKGSDKIRVQLFHETDGARSYLLNTTVTADIAWTPATFDIPAVTDANAVGKPLQLLFIPGQDSESSTTEWASIDDVSLTRNGPPTVLPGTRSLTITGNYTGSDCSILALTLEPSAESTVKITGTAALAGNVRLTLAPGFSPAHEENFPLLTSAAISGTFVHPGDRLTANTGQPFHLSYSATTVTLTAIGLTPTGTPYDWLEENHLVLPGSDDSAYEAAALRDGDGDGASAADEYLAGTDPNISTSVFLATLTPTPENSFTLGWPSVGGRRYTILSSPDLATPFTPFSGPHAATPPHNSATVPLDPSGRRFFRIAVEIE